MKRLLCICAALLGLLLLLLGVCAARAFLVEERRVHVPPPTDFDLDVFGLSQRLARILRVQSVSRPGEFDHAVFASLLRELAEVYPRAHAQHAFERVGERALLYRLAGSDPSLPPAILLAHLDVVPVEEETRASWKRPPFSGELSGGYVWGRGSLDDKSAAVALLEAVELQTRRGRQPRRDVWIALGLDEEIGGQGAREVASLLEERGVRPFLVLDEGSFLLEGFLDFLDAPLAAIGVAEKGGLLVELAVELPGGHAALPEGESAIGLLARALERLEGRPAPASLDPPFSWTLDRIAPALAWQDRFFLSNRWLFGPLVRARLERSPAVGSALRTTLALTRVEGGLAPNVRPGSARALCDLRLHPRDTLEAALERLRATIDDPRIDLRVLESRPPSAISPAEGEAWELLERTVLQLFPEARVAPSLCIAGTDSRHYARLGGPIYRFRPVPLRPEDLPRIHGVDERIELAAHAGMVRFFAQLLVNL